MEPTAKLSDGPPGSSEALSDPARASVGLPKIGRYIGVSRTFRRYPGQDLPKTLYTRDKSTNILVPRDQVQPHDTSSPGREEPGRKTMLSPKGFKRHKSRAAQKKDGIRAARHDARPKVRGKSSLAGSEARAQALSKLDGREVRAARAKRDFGNQPAALDPLRGGGNENGKVKEPLSPASIPSTTTTPAEVSGILQSPGDGYASPVGGVSSPTSSSVSEGLSSPARGASIAVPTIIGLFLLALAFWLLYRCANRRIPESGSDSDPQRQGKRGSEESHCNPDADVERGQYSQFDIDVDSTPTAPGRTLAQRDRTPRQSALSHLMGGRTGGRFSVFGKSSPVPGSTCLDTPERLGATVAGPDLARGLEMGGGWYHATPHRRAGFIHLSSPDTALLNTRDRTYPQSPTPAQTVLMDYTNRTPGAYVSSPRGTPIQSRVWQAKIEEPRSWDHRSRGTSPSWSPLISMSVSPGSPLSAIRSPGRSPRCPSVASISTLERIIEEGESEKEEVVPPLPIFSNSLTVSSSNPCQTLLFVSDDDDEADQVSPCRLQDEAADHPISQQAMSVKVDGIEPGRKESIRRSASQESSITAHSEASGTGTRSSAYTTASARSSISDLTTLSTISCLSSFPETPTDSHQGFDVHSHSPSLPRVRAHRDRASRTSTPTPSLGSASMTGDTLGDTRSRDKKTGMKSSKSFGKSSTGYIPDPDPVEPAEERETRHPDGRGKETKNRRTRSQTVTTASVRHVGFRTAVGRTMSLQPTKIEMEAFERMQKDQEAEAFDALQGMKALQKLDRETSVGETWHRHTSGCGDVEFDDGMGNGEDQSVNDDLRDFEERLRTGIPPRESDDRPQSGLAKALTALDSKVPSDSSPRRGRAQSFPGKLLSRRLDSLHRTSDSVSGAASAPVNGTSNGFSMTTTTTSTGRKTKRNSEISVRVPIPIPRGRGQVGMSGIVSRSGVDPSNALGMLRLQTLTLGSGGGSDDERSNSPSSPNSPNSLQSFPVSPTESEMRENEVEGCPISLYEASIARREESAHATMPFDASTTVVAETTEVEVRGDDSEYEGGFDDTAGNEMPEAIYHDTSVPFSPGWGDTDPLDDYYLGTTGSEFNFEYYDSDEGGNVANGPGVVPHIKVTSH